MWKRLFVGGALALHAIANSDGDLLVQTDLFKVQGALEENMTNVRVFRGVPFAEPPLGRHRFKPPVTKRPEAAVVDASWFSPSCMQLNTGAKTVYTEYLPGFLLTPGQQQSEDCLTLNIWAPRKAPDQSFPVMIYIPGGGYTSGGGASPYKYGGPIVRDQQDVVVVSMNYRLNIFGFPNAAALDNHNLNLGLLDQRAAVVWIYNNIAAFGGDPSRMILWGQSAGTGSADKYAYAWADDPIVTGFALDSGTGDGLGISGGSSSNFTYVAQQVGCEHKDKDDEFACMQSKEASEIIKVLNEYNATMNDGKSLSFGPTVDNETSFGNYADLQARGKFARIPILVGSNDNEWASLAPYTPGVVPNETYLEVVTRQRFACPAARAAETRRQWDVPAWRYEYYGEFPNTMPLPWLKAYHSSELPMVFGTGSLLGPDTELERKTSRYMQGAWVAFAKDPVNGLSEYGWPVYEVEGSTLVQLGLKGNPMASFADPGQVDGTCEAS